MQKVKKFFIKNYQFIWCLVLLLIILIVAINPEPFISSTFAGIKIWATIVLPSLFCFFIFTTMLMQNKSTLKIFSFLDKPFKKLYNTPNFGGYIFAMSVISGYPVGAKLISEFYEQNLISKAEAHRLSSYCSTSGPMFILGSIASSMICNIKIGMVIFVCHILATLINGLIYRNYLNNSKTIKENMSSNKYMIDCHCNKNKLKTTINAKSKGIGSKEIEIKKQTLNDIMQNTITSVLMVGGFIVISFTLLEIINVTSILKPIYIICDKILPSSSGLAKGIFNGIAELTNGCVSICKLFSNDNTLVVTTILCGLVSFGGISIHLQSYSFLSKCKIKYKYFLLTKITQTAISIVLCLILGTIIL